PATAASPRSSVHSVVAALAAGAAIATRAAAASAAVGVFQYFSFMAEVSLSAAQRGDGVVAAGGVAERVDGVRGHSGVTGVVLLPHSVPLAAVPGGGEDLLEAEGAGAALDDVVAVPAVPVDLPVLEVEGGETPRVGLDVVD